MCYYNNLHVIILKSHATFLNNLPFLSVYILFWILNHFIANVFSDTWIIVPSDVYAANRGSKLSYVLNWQNVKRTIESLSPCLSRYLYFEIHLLSLSSSCHNLVRSFACSQIVKLTTILTMWCSYVTTLQ